jgi:preprotein translocase subunit SecY
MLQNPAGVAFGGIVLVLGIGLLLIFAIVVFQEATRKIPVQYARSLFRSGRMYRQSSSTHIPLKVNSAGMIPLIFAYTIIIFPATLAQPFVTSSNDTISALAEFVASTFTPRSPVYWFATFFLVMIFTFFYTVVVFQQQNIAENLQKQGGFIPGIRPGRPTQEYITRVLTRITWAGAIFLGVVAVIPFAATRFFDEQAFQLSATGLLIVVGVVLDTMRQLEAQLLMRQYEGFIR